MLSVARPVVMFSFHERSFIISSLAAAIRAPGDALIETMSARRVRLVLVRFFFSHTVASNPCPAHDMSLTAQESEREREKKGPVKKDEWHTLSRWTLSLCYFFFLCVARLALSPVVIIRRCRCCCLGISGSLFVWPEKEVNPVKLIRGSSRE